MKSLRITAAFRCSLALVLAAAGFALAAGSASAATSNLADVACYEAEACFGVGGSDGTGANQGQVSEWGGSGWSSVETPTATDAALSQLDEVACASPSMCVAVGNYTVQTYVGQNATVPLGVSWDGEEWSLLNLPTAAGAKSSKLTGVNCPAVEYCVAVGRSSDAAGDQTTLAMVMSGAEWTVVPTPNPAEGSLNELSSVSCWSTSGCVAVGSFVNSGEVTKTLVLLWDGEEWTIESSPEPGGATLSRLAAVDCFAEDECAAAGAYADAGGTLKTLTLHRDSEEWSLVSSPNPAEALSSSLSGVACVSAEVCRAVGSYKDGSSDLPLALSYNGSSWSQKAIGADDLGAQTLELAGVACVTASECQAVGAISYGHGAARHDLAFEWNGSSWFPTETGGFTTSWKPVELAESAGGTIDLSCPDFTYPGACIMVGSMRSGSLEHASISYPEQGGEGWFPQGPGASGLAGAPTGAVSDRLEAVTCFSLNACMTVGKYVDGSGAEGGYAIGLFGVEAGASPVATPEPGGAKSSRLTGLACASESACIAVGSYVDSGDVRKPLAVSWNGSTWSLMTIAAPAGAQHSELFDVSCSAASSCAAVGRYVDSVGEPKALAYSWNGSEWSAIELPELEANAADLTAVGCAEERCFGLGRYVDTSGVTKVLALKPDTSKPLTKWVTAGAPSVGEGLTPELSDIVCFSKSSCLAVGGAGGTESPATPLVYAWSGSSWSDYGVSGPSETGVYLRGVACNEGCWVAGAATTSGSTNQIDFVSQLAGSELYEPAVGTPLAATMYSVSCVPSSSTGVSPCMAIGYGSPVEEGVTTAPVAWSNTEEGWEISGRLVGVHDISCSGANACTAVGSSTGPVSRWNGTTWSKQTTASPAGATSWELRAVSCSSATHCSAVGRTFTPLTKPLIEIWNGTSWSVQTWSGPELVDISCVSSTSCLAVGTSESKGLVARWNGTSWSSEFTPSPEKAKTVTLGQVSCSAANACTAIGFYHDGTSAKPYIVRWNGSSWSIQTAAKGLTSNTYTDLSCYTASRCVATTATGLTGTDIVAWDGTEWSEEEIIGTNKYSLLEGVSCASKADCVAVGSGYVEGEGAAAVTLAPIEGGEEGQVASDAVPTGTPAKTFTPIQEEQAEEILSEDPALVGKIGAGEYELRVGPWTEIEGGEEVLVGAVAELTLAETASWPSLSTNWPVVTFDSPIEPSPYGESSMNASGSNIEVLQVNLAAVVDEADNLLEGEVVQLVPTAAGEGEYTYQNNSIEKRDLEFMGY